MSVTINGKDVAAGRVELYTATTVDTTGNVAGTFATPFLNPPTVLPVVGWSGTQMAIIGNLTATTTGWSGIMMISKGTLVLTSGPFQAANTSGISANFVAMGI